MKFFCRKNNLLEGVNIVQKGTSTRTTLPILEGILVETTPEGVKLTSNDLEVGMECTLEANVVENGSSVVESRTFSDIIRRLPEGDISINVDEGGIFTIECGGSLYKLSSMNPDDFPRLPEIKADESVLIKQNVLKEMIRQTIFAVSVDENRPVFTGSLLEVDEGNLNMVAVDGFRLSLRRYIHQLEGKSINVVVPGKALNEILKILQANDKDVAINVSKNQVLFEIEKCKIVSRLLEGEFLNYKAAIPQEMETRIKVKRDELLSAFERIYLITREEKKYPVKVKVEENIMTIVCSSTIGNAREEIGVEKEGKDIEIGFNPKYFIDALKAVNHEYAYIDFTTSMAPCVIRPLEGEEFIHMILPVRIRDDGNQ